MATWRHHKPKPQTCLKRSSCSRCCPHSSVGCTLPLTPPLAKEKRQFGTAFADSTPRHEHCWEKWLARCLREFGHFIADMYLGGAVFVPFEVLGMRLVLGPKVMTILSAFIPFAFFAAGKRWLLLLPRVLRSPSLQHDHVPSHGTWPNHEHKPVTQSVDGICASPVPSAYGEQHPQRRAPRTCILGHLIWQHCRPDRRLSHRGHSPFSKRTIFL